MQRSQSKISTEIHLEVNKNIRTNKDGLSSVCKSYQARKLINVDCDKYSLNRKVRILNVYEGKHKGASETLSAWCSREEDLQLQGVPEEEAELRESSSAGARERLPLTLSWLIAVSGCWFEGTSQI